MTRPSQNLHRVLSSLQVSNSPSVIETNQQTKNEKTSPQEVKNKMCMLSYLGLSTSREGNFRIDLVNIKKRED